MQYILYNAIKKSYDTYNSSCDTYFYTHIPSMK